MSRGGTALPAGAVVGLLDEGAGAVTVGVGLDVSVGVAPLVAGLSVVVPAEDFLRLKMDLSLSKASRAGLGMF